MFRKLLSILLICSSIIVFAQDVTLIPYGNPVVIDGEIHSNEWNGADSVMIDILGGTKQVKVLYKHDSTNFYFAFLGNLESVNARYPEVLFDVNNDKGTSWDVDDWWFHVSATDCEYQGQASNYDSCMAVRPHWKAEPNFAAGPPNTDTVEIQIPFSTIGLDILITDTFGLAFDVTNTFSAWEYWPFNAQIGNPSTWANAVFELIDVTSIEKQQAPAFSVFPNPFTTVLYVSFETAEPREIQLVDSRGQLVFTNQSDAAIEIPLAGQLAPGLYFLKVAGSSGEAVKKVVVQ